MYEHLDIVISKFIGDTIMVPDVTNTYNESHSYYW